jgi:DNA polymerase I-like protein with 3'-5' exonuclease and polymerase domains
MTLPNFIAIDVETTLNGDLDVGLANPMHPANRIVAFGISSPSGEISTTYDSAVWKREILTTPVHSTFVGHNLSFDLLYLYRDSSIMRARLQDCKIWDTQLAEYILTGQQSKFSSLDELSIKYGLEVKDDHIKAYFQAGMGADKIPLDELVPYLIQDVYNAWAIAELQYRQAVHEGMLTLILTQMEALHATTEMTYNGLQIDTTRLREYTVEVVDSYVEAKLELEERCSGHIEDINSPKQWSQYFFGGTKKIKVREEVGVYKNGNTKYKLVDKELVIKPAVKYIPDPDKVSEKTGQVSVDDTVLEDMLRHTFDPSIKGLVEALLKYRELSKQLSTYVQGLSKHIIAGRIHGRLNHTATVTGRLSSTSPNLQNISNNPIKQIFASRFRDGMIVEVDFNQLEVVALAHVTKDTQLIRDISSGVDIHSALYEGLYGRLPTKEERKPFKARTFQLNDRPVTQ